LGPSSHYELLHVWFSSRTSLDLNEIVNFLWHVIDWDSIEIEKRCDEEGLQQTICEKVLYDKLGLKQEDENQNKAREDKRSKSFNDNDVKEHTCGDEVPDGLGLLGDWKKPVMNLGA
jgi:hypothetical protein